MDNRYAKRSDVNERVELWNGTENYGEFNLSNLSTSGAFVQNSESKLCELSHKPLKIVFCNNPNTSFQKTFNAVIVREAHDGIGVKWTQ